MASALKYAGYDVRFDWAEGYAHNADFGGAKFPEAMKWLWRKETHTPVLDTKGDLGGDLTLLNLLIRGESWDVVADGIGFADALCADKAGSLYFCDMKAPSVVRIATDGTRKEICRESVSGLEFNPDGSLLYGCQGAKNRVISIDPNSGEVRVVAVGVKPNDLAVTGDGFILITETGAQQVTRIDPKTGEVKAVDTGISKPNGIALTRWRYARGLRLRWNSHLDVPSQCGRSARRENAHDANATADRPERGFQVQRTATIHPELKRRRNGGRQSRSLLRDERTGGPNFRPNRPPLRTAPQS